MVSTSQIAELLDELEHYSDTPEDEAGASRKKIWDQIVEELAKSPKEVSAELAGALGVSQVTVERWMRGEYAPRAALLVKLRDHFGVTVTNEDKMGGLKEDAPVRFAGSYAALRTLDHYFFSLQYVTCSFVFKGMMEYHAGHQSKTLKRVIDSLERNQDLVIYYVFPEGSPAANTFKELHNSLDRDFPGIQQNVKERIKSVPIPSEKDAMGLKFSLASPFFVKYGNEGKKKFNRSVDLWYEVPVEPLSATGDVNDDKELSVFVQLPPSLARDLWKEWSKSIRNLKSTRIETEHLD